MTTTLPNTGVVTPTPGGDAGTWGTENNAAWANYDVHDHSVGKGVRITPAAININADLPLNSSWGITAANRISFASVAAASTNKSLFVSDGTSGLVSGELYWRSNAGSQVRLTNGASLNVAAFTGGIGGDYVSVGAAVAFDDAGDRYTFKQQSNLWARMASGDVRLFETGSTDSVFVGLAAPAALAGSYTITMPLAAPGSTSLVQMDSSGVLTASNTVGNAVTLSSTLGVTGLATVGGTLGVTGLITATAGLTAAANQHVTVSGTGRLKHGSRTKSMGAGALAIFTGGGSINTLTGYTSAGGTAVDVSATIVLDVGQRITAIRVFVIDSATGPTTLTATFRSMTSVGVSALIATSNTSAGSGASQTLTMTSLTTTLSASTAYNIRIQSAGGTAVTSVNMLEVDYDEP